MNPKVNASLVEVVREDDTALRLAIYRVELPSGAVKYLAVPYTPDDFHVGNVTVLQ